MTALTKHQKRIQVVRDRLNAITPKIKHTSRRGGLTPYGTFAERMATVAREGGEWPWRQKQLTSGGAPKDLATTLRTFAEGRGGLHEGTLDLVELTCIEFERELRLAKSEAIIAEAERHTLIGIGEGGLPSAADANAAALARMRSAVPAGRAERDREAQLGNEIEALHAVNNALDQLEPAEQSRVLRWAADKYGVIFNGA